MKLRNLIFILLMSVLFLFTVVPAQATPIWGSDASAELIGQSRTSPASSGVVATQQWDDGGFTIGWDIVENITTSLWTYTYTVTTVQKDISHFILEVTEDDEDFNIYDGTTGPYEGPTTWSVNDGKSNPLMPNPIYGVKFDFGEEDEPTIYTIVTDRAPVYGVFYAKDGKTGGVDLVAWSTALNSADYKTNESLTATDFIVRPDGANGDIPPHSVPEPATMLLIGSGLIGIAVSGKKRFKRRNG